MKTKEVLNSILSRFERGDIPEIVAFSMFTCSDIPSSKWSLQHRPIQYINGTNAARGFRQWQKVNRHVVKGAKALFILAPLMGKVEKDGAEQTVLKGFKGVPVFRVEDTEGDPLEYEKLQLPDFPLQERAKEWGLTVRAVPAAGKTYGYYSPRSHEIGLATDEEQVFFHELAHAAHSIVKGSLEFGQDWKQEIVAELSAASLCYLVGRRPERTLGNSYRYIKTYAEKANLSPYSACQKVLADVEKVLYVIMEGKLPDSGNSPAGDKLSVSAASR